MLALLLFSFSIFFTELPDDQLRLCRSLYFAENTETNAESLMAHCSALRADVPLTRAYLGAATARSAEHSYNPYTKYQRFNKGTTSLDQSVAQAPDNPEIRLLRLVIQLKAPSFLGYNSNIDKDRKLVLKALIDGWWTDDPEFQSNIANFLLQKAALDTSERLLVRDLIETS